jgi:hypothetical protein
MAVMYQKRHTDCVRDQRVLIKEFLYSRTINRMVVLIYGLARSVKTSVSSHIIDTRERYALRKISTHSHIRNTNHWYGTPRTRAETKIADADYNYSRAYL